MTERPIDASGGAPEAASGSWVFGLLSAAFLVALVLAGLAMPSESSPAERAPVPPILARGEAVFEGEGCAGCHSRLVRSRDRGMGPSASSASLAGDSGVVGSSRLGPDLQNLSVRYPRSLLEVRLGDPRVFDPGTIMPSYRRLSVDDRDALIAFLQRPLAAPTGWEAIRAKNDIEPAVPDEVLASLREYLDPETGTMVLPVQDTPEFLVTGRGLYNSRCAACHGIAGKGDGPASWDEMPRGVGKAVPLVPPADFTQPRFDEYSEVMWYWRIAEGIPGTKMPAWGESLSEDALWFLVGYARALSTDEAREKADSRPAEATEERMGPENGTEFPTTSPPVEDAGSSGAVSGEEIQGNSIPAESASEEEGA